MGKPKTISKKRLWRALLIVCLLFFMLIYRLYIIQVRDADFYQKMALMQQNRDIVIPAQRGTIYDRNMMKLAYSVNTYTVWADPREIEDVDEAAEYLSDILYKDAADIKDQIENSSTTLVKVEKWVDKSTADLIKNKNMKGVWVAEDTKRVYPYQNLASHVVGHTTIDGTGIAGIEYMYNTELAGTPGMLSVTTDAAGRQLSYGKSELYEPIDGYNVVLTIDEVIQHFTEKALLDAMEEFGPKRAMAIVMDPKTGEVLAMSAKPDYNPNDPWNLELMYDDIDVEGLTEEEKTVLWNQAWRNPNVSDTYEPGSTFKLITSAAGIENNVVTPNTKFNTVGYSVVSGVRLRCWRYPGHHGEETLTEGLENSCNPVFVEVSQALGKSEFYKYIKGFGFTEKTGIELPGEANSILLPESKLGPVEMATISFGHGIAVTPIQMVTGVSAIANGGYLMEPMVVTDLIDNEGNVVESYEPTVVRQVISETTSKEVRLMMESVVLNGSGKLAYIPGIRVGGKTGTSEKIVDGAYSDDLAISSFIGVAPIEDPEIVVLVIVDEPQESNFGSVVGAPIANQIMVDTLRYLGVEPDLGKEIIDISTPNLIGKTLASAEEILGAVGIEYTTEPFHVEDPTAIITDQYPRPGEMVSTGGIVILKVEE